MTETTVRALESVDIRALKHADRVTVHTYKGDAYLRAHIVAEHSPTGFDDFRDIGADWTMRDYTNGDKHIPADEARSRYVCFSMWHHGVKYDYNGVLTTIVGAMREGDRVTFRWVRSNNSDNTRSVGWSRDELYIVLTHKNGREQTFLADVYVGPDNTARMCKVTL